jgi:hypothetical protein
VLLDVGASATLHPSSCQSSHHLHSTDGEVTDFGVMRVLTFTALTGIRWLCMAVLLFPYLPFARRRIIGPWQLIPREQLTAADTTDEPMVRS